MKTENKYMPTYPDHLLAAAVGMIIVISVKAFKVLVGGAKVPSAGANVLVGGAKVPSAGAKVLVGGAKVPSAGDTTVAPRYKHKTKMRA
jgi:hypothetical protein